MLPDPPKPSTLLASLAARERRRLAARVAQPHRGRLWLAMRIVLIFAILGLLTGFHGALMALHPYLRAAERYDITEVSHYRTGCLVVDSTGQDVGRIFASNLDPVSVEDLPPHLIHALIATEDAQFFHHSGADLLAIARAAIVNFRNSRITQGASTITQQLARCVYQMDERTFERKLLELFLARRIERHYSKDEILEQYLNRIYFGNGCWGIGAAARDFFGKTVQELTIEESALLVGIIKRPVGFSPYLNPAAARLARDHTLHRMEKLGFLTPEDGRHFRAGTLHIQPRSDRSDAPHYLLDQTEHETRLIFQQQNLPAEGYVVQTSADRTLQERVRQAISKTLPKIESSLQTARSGTTPAEPLQVAAVLIHNRTGRVLAAVGGRNYEQSQFNRVFQARRAPGSSFLPLVYASVFDHPRLGPRTFTLDTAIDNRKVMIGGRHGVLGEWGTELLETVYEGEIPAAYALLRAKNAATVRLGTLVGLDAVCSLAREAGIDSELRPYPATFLGASEVSLLELTRAYTVFPNQGLKPPPASLVDYIAKPDGTLVYQRQPPPTASVISNTTAGQISRILQMSLYSAPGASSPDSQGLCSTNLAGKSGTVHDFTDAWFVGFDAEITCGVWIGYDQPRPLSSEGFGRTIALPLWVEIMNSLGADSPLPAVELFDAHGPLFCNFPNEQATGAEGCPCILHRPGSPATYVLQAEPLRPAADLPRPVRPQVPVLTGEDPYGSSWPARQGRN